MKLRVYPYRQESMSARSLSRALGARVLKTDGTSEFTGGPDWTIINWGNSSPPFFKGTIINKPAIVKDCVSKIRFFTKMKGSNISVSVPDFTVDLKEALEWVEQGFMVLGRKRDNASGGEGITFIEDFTNFEKCVLFTKYKKKKEEYRVHVMSGHVFLVQKKVLRKEDDAGNPIDPSTIDFRIRNLANGFIFQRHGFEVPNVVIAEALSAFTASGLDFGAFDVIYNEQENRAYVLEANTAPGLEGTTVDDYANAFKEHFLSE